MKVALYFQVHQPYRLKKYNVFEIGNNPFYFDNKKNQEIMDKVANNCYLPTNKILLDLLNRYKDFKINFSISGVALDQFQEFSPEVLDSFKELAKTEKVEFLAETYYHSLSSIFSDKEFSEQVLLHKQKILELFDQESISFRNTELIYNDDIAKKAASLGFKTILTEGSDRILKGNSPNYVYKSSEGQNLLLKNFILSDDIAFRFKDTSWIGYPLTGEKFSSWIKESPGDVINLFMDFETFGEHHDESIIHFLKDFIESSIKKGIKFINIKDVDSLEKKQTLQIKDHISWADKERDLSAWVGSKIQKSAANAYFNLEQSLKQIKNEDLLKIWRHLGASDHFYYMSTKGLEDGSVHKNFSPYESPYDAFINYSNVLKDLKLRIEQKIETKEVQL